MKDKEKPSTGRPSRRVFKTEGPEMKGSLVHAEKQKARIAEVE